MLGFMEGFLGNENPAEEKKQREERENNNRGERFSHTRSWFSSLSSPRRSAAATTGRAHGLRVKDKAENAGRITRR